MVGVEKRYQVFVSSTYLDLIEARQEVMQALLELDCIPAGMELFPAADDDQWTLIKKVIDDCDYYIVVVGGRYGSIATTGKSFTQMEYEYALESGKPAIAFLHKDPGSLPANQSEQTEDGSRKLQEFRSLVQKKVCKNWTTPADLGSVVSRSIVKLMKSNPGVGWVKADALPTQSATDELLRLRRQIEDLQNQLGEARAASTKTTEHLAQGDDPIKVRYTFRATYYEPTFSQRDFYSEASLSWDGLFAQISPLLIDEGSDQRLKSALGDYLFTLESPVHRMEESIKKAHSISDYTIDDDSYETIKVQFLALGLIQKSVRKKARSVNDRHAYWTLTLAGEDLMMRLRAIRRSQPALSEVS